MPNDVFNDAFFLPMRDPINRERLATTLEALYPNARSEYFEGSETVDAVEDLNRFKNSSKFVTLKTQYVAVLEKLNAWCDKHKILNKPLARNAQNTQERRELSAFELHQEILFNSDGKHYSYGVRAGVFFGEGKKSLEILYMLLQDNALPLDKKKMVMQNLQASIIACADGTLTNILDAKNELLASTTVQGILQEAKRVTLQQLAFAFHRFVLYEDYDESVPMETHNIVGYLDEVVTQYGLPIRADQTRPNIPLRALTYFPDYVHEAFNPNLIIDNVLTQLEPLFLQFHQVIQGFFKETPSMDYPTYTEKHRSNVERKVEEWNNKYGFLCPITTNDFVEFNQETGFLKLAPIHLVRLKASITHAFRQQYLRDAKPFILKNKANPSDEIEYVHGIFWRVKEGEICALTPEDLSNFPIPDKNHPDFMAYWFMVDTLLQKYPDEQEVLLSRIIEQLDDILTSPMAVWELAKHQHFSLIELLIKQDLMKPEHLAQVGLMDKNTSVNVIWLLAYYKKTSLLEALSLKKCLPLPLLEASPQQGFFAEMTPLWLLTAAKAFPLIQALINRQQISLPQLDMNETALQAGRQSVLWMLSHHQQFSIIQALFNQKLITSRLLNHRGNKGKLAHTNSLLQWILKLNASNELAILQLFLTCRNENLLTPEHLSSSLTAAVYGSFEEVKLLWILATMKRFQLISDLLDQNLIRKEHLTSRHLDPFFLILAMNGQSNLMKKIIEVVTDIPPSLFEEPSISLNAGINLFWWLVVNQEIDFIGFLLEKGLITPIQLCAHTRTGPVSDCTAFSILVETQQLNLVSRFAKAGLTVQIGKKHPAIYANTQPTLTPLNVVAEKLNKLITLYKLTPDFKSQTFLAKALRMAANANKPDDLKLLLDLDNKLINMTGPSTGKTALHFAVENQHLDCIKILIEAGARTDIRDINGKTVLQLARSLQPQNLQLNIMLNIKPENDQISCVWKVLVECGLNDDDPKTLAKALRMAAANDKANALTLLLRLYPELLNEQDPKCNKTALYHAVIRGHKACVELLLSAGANPDIPDSEGNTPRALAEKAGNSEICQLLDSQKPAVVNLEPRTASAANPPIVPSTTTQQTATQPPMTPISTSNSSSILPLTPQPVSASFLLRVLAHPATKVIAVVLILAGIAGLIYGGLGLAGIGIGVSLLAAGIITGVAAGTVVLGSGLLTTGFFASSRLDAHHLQVGQGHAHLHV